MMYYGIPKTSKQKNKGFPHPPDNLSDAPICFSFLALLRGPTLPYTGFLGALYSRI